MTYVIKWSVKSNHKDNNKNNTNDINHNNSNNHNNNKNNNDNNNVQWVTTKSRIWCTPAVLVNENPDKVYQLAMIYNEP